MKTSAFSIAFSYVRRTLPFILTNKTQSPPRIIWDNCAFINVDKTSSGIIHGGTKSIDRGQTKMPTVIAAGIRVDDVVVPQGNICRLSGRYAGWRKSLLVPETIDQARSGRSLTIDTGGREEDFLLGFDVKKQLRTDVRPR